MFMPMTAGAAGAAFVGEYGASIAFSSGDLLASTTDLTDTGTGDFTWEAWFKPTAFGTNFQSVIGIGTSATSGYIKVRSFDATREIISPRWANGISFSDTLTPRGIEPGTWHHVALCRDSGALRLFRDGDYIRNFGLQAQAVVTGPLCLASSTSNTATDSFIGKLAKVRFSDLARYTAAFTPDKDYGVDASTLALIGSFDGGATISDAAGNYTLTAVAGAPTADSEGVS